MKILLVGEYSRLHNSLKEGLQSLGHDVLLLGQKDGFKNFDVDIFIGARFFNSRLIFPFTKLINKIFNINLIGWENTYRFKKLFPILKGFDIVQLYNESIVKHTTKHEIEIVSSLINSNKNVYLLSCGIDHTSIKYAYDKKFKYSILTPFFENKNLKNDYENLLKKLDTPALELHNYLFNHLNGVIASDLDYHLPLLEFKAYLGMVPNPINIDKIKFIAPILNEKVIIFHGVNTSNAIRKGASFFDDALKIIAKKYQECVHILRVENLPYEDYISYYDSCHILLDQVYSYDQGYNALEAMAKGKVVFTGAEKEWLDYFNLEEDTVAINALPDVDYLVSKLSWLIETPEKIIEIAHNARQFIEAEHNYIEIAQKYIDTWQKKDIK
nr:glycosyltransferase [uncultured Psychroserpens sp.]